MTKEKIIKSMVDIFYNIVKGEGNTSELLSNLNNAREFLEQDQIVISANYSDSIGDFFISPFAPVLYQYFGGVLIPAKLKYLSKDFAIYNIDFFGIDEIIRKENIGSEWFTSDIEAYESASEKKAKELNDIIKNLDTLKKI